MESERWGHGHVIGGLGALKLARSALSPGRFKEPERPEEVFAPDTADSRGRVRFIARSRTAFLEWEQINLLPE